MSPRRDILVPGCATSNKCSEHLFRPNDNVSVVFKFNFPLRRDVPFHKNSHLALIKLFIKFSISLGTTITLPLQLIAFISSIESFKKEMLKT